MTIDFQLYRRSVRRQAQHYIFFGEKLHWSEEDIRAALSASTTIQRTAEIECSIEMSERESARTAKRGESAERRLTAIAAKYGATVDWSGDPRGCPSIVYPPREGEEFTRRYPID